MMNKRLILFLVDGMRPDGLQQADAPTLQRLMQQGSTSLTAQTVMPSVTLPCHTSLFLGVRPERHGVTTNTWTPPARPVPGLVDELQRAGKSTAMFYNWEQLRDLSQPDALHASFFLKNCYDPQGSGDTALSELAAAWLAQHSYDFIFVYLGYVDTAGHDRGWMSQAYLDGIANADRCIQRILDVLPADTHVIVTSDHGGHAQNHGSDLPEDLTIPMILAGPGIPAGQMMDGKARITDLAPTIARLLDIPQPKEWIGTPLV